MAYARYQIAERNYFYDDRIHADNAVHYLPHIQDFRDVILDFSFPAQNFNTVQDLLDRDGKKAAALSKASMEFVEQAGRAHDNALFTKDGNHSEKEWERIFHDDFFAPLQQSTSPARGDSRRVSRRKYCHELFFITSDKLWTAFQRREGLLEKRPKPDHAFYLPIYMVQNGNGLPKVHDSEATQWPSNLNENLVEPYTWTTLKQLSNFGLRPSPFYNTFDDPPTAAAMLCYPWFIIEHKKEGRGEDEVACQAVNAAAGAITLLQNTARYATKLPDHAHIPPIPTVTTVGPLVKVWITHYDDDIQAHSTRESLRYSHECQTGYIMRLIWEGDITNLSDVVKLRMILENIHGWAMHVFKPLIASYITQWKRTCLKPAGSLETPLSLCSPLADYCQSVTPLVNSYMREQSIAESDSHGFTTSTALTVGLLVQHICSSERRHMVEDVKQLLDTNLEAVKSTASNTETRDIVLARERSLAPPDWNTSTRNTTVEPDDPMDSDYVPSQPLRLTSHDHEVQETDDVFGDSSRSIRDPFLNIAEWQERAKTAIQNVIRKRDELRRSTDQLFQA